MIIEYHKNFTKQFEKLHRKEQDRVLNTLKLFENEPNHIIVVFAAIGSHSQLYG